MDIITEINVVNKMLSTKTNKLQNLVNYKPDSIVQKCSYCKLTGHTRQNCDKLKFRDTIRNMAELGAKFVQKTEHELHIADPPQKSDTFTCNSKDSNGTFIQNWKSGCTLGGNMLKEGDISGPYIINDFFMNKDTEQKISTRGHDQGLMNRKFLTNTIMEDDLSDISPVRKTTKLDKKSELSHQKRDTGKGETGDMENIEVDVQIKLKTQGKAHLQVNKKRLNLT